MRGTRVLRPAWRKPALALAAAALALALVATAAVGSPARRGADTVLVNGFVYTVDAKNRVAQAVAIEDGVIRYVGSDRGARRFIGPDTKVIDLGGRMAMPGIHEGHIHSVINSDQPDCNMGAGPLTVPEFQAKVQACLDDPQFNTSTPGAPDNFLLVSDLYFQFLRPAGTTPHKSMLDALDNPANRPIVVTAAVTGHNILVNQAALDLAGITAATPDPIGGRIDHDPSGEPNGILQDAAQGLVYAHVPPPPPVSAERQVELAGERMQEFSREGITSFFQPLSPEPMIKTFAALQDAGGLTARASFAPLANPLTQTPDEIYARLERIRAENEDPDEIPLSVRSWRPGRQTGPRYVAAPGVTVGSAKIVLDGIAQAPAQTAYLGSPYLTQTAIRAPTSTPGASLRRQHAPRPARHRPHRPRLPVAHPRDRRRRGDVALDAIEKAQEAYPRLRSHPTIAHAEIVDPVDYPRFGELDVTASMGLQWAKPAPDSTEAVKPFLGARWDWYEPTVPITEGGGRVSLGSDCCLDPFDEWFDLEVAILREADWGPEFPQFEGTLNALPGLSLREGIRAVTINGAYQMHQEKVTGSLEVGKLADLIVLDQNITQIPLDDISDTDVLLTLVGGETVWRDPAF